MDYGFLIQILTILSFIALLIAMVYRIDVTLMFLGFMYFFIKLFQGKPDEALVAVILILVGLVFFILHEYEKRAIPEE